MVREKRTNKQDYKVNLKIKGGVLDGIFHKTSLNGSLDKSNWSYK